MQNRLFHIMNSQSPDDPDDVRQFFLACEYKPGGEFWNLIEPFTYDIKPAYMYGSLGVMSYEPESYSVVEVNEKAQPLMGYLLTITHPETIDFLDRAKYYLGEDAFSFHIRRLVKVYTGPKEVTNAWCYVVSNPVLAAYQQVETVEFGMWDDDEKQIKLLEQITQA